jgi:cob(I)alamin adenosyltransferase
MKLTKIYTKTGDGGETSLVGGIRIAKNAPRIEAYGTVDELSSHLGLLAAMLGKDAEHGEEYRPIIETLERIQNNLFSISSILATDAEALRRKDDEWVKPYLESLEKFTEQLGGTETPLLERLTDEYNAELPALGSFIMPGGSVEAAQCHVCRAVCRRAERRMVDKVQGDKVQGTKDGKGEELLWYSNELNQETGIGKVGQYMNRLSDYLFVLARKINIINGETEKTWQNTCK